MIRRAPITATAAQIASSAPTIQSVVGHWSSGFR